MLPDRHTAKAGIRPELSMRGSSCWGSRRLRCRMLLPLPGVRTGVGAGVLRWLVLLPLARVGTGPGRLSGGCHHCGGWLGGWVIDGPFACAGQFVTVAPSAALEI